MEEIKERAGERSGNANRSTREENKRSEVNKRKGSGQTDLAETGD